MTSAALHADPVATAGAFHDGADTVVVPRSRLQELEAAALRAEFDARNIQLLQEQIAQANNALAREQACSERQAEAFMEVARASENRARDLEVQYANRARDLEVQYTEKLAKLEATHDAVVAAQAASIAELKKQNAQLEASHARAITAKDTALAKLECDQATMLRAEVAAQVSAVHAVVTSKLALELHPVRRDRRQFATLHTGPVPFDKFDTAWCAASGGKKQWKVDIDSLTQTRAHLKQHGRAGTMTLRGAAPLPRCLPCTGTSPQQLPSYCVIIEAYPAPDSDGNGQWCNVGFVPSHTSTDGASVTPVMGRGICNYGGWWIQLQPAAACGLGRPTVVGWTPLLPRAAAGDAVGAALTSTYATSDEAPPVPAGSAVEFAVDCAAGTCRVAFYTPAAVAGGFLEAPHAKMELRFAATTARDVRDWGAVPARSVPTAASSRVQLYPAVEAAYAGAVWRFV
jgi:hypothetical protein